MTSNSDKLTIFDLSTRTIRSPSLSISSNNSSINILGHKQRFDDRSTTKTSLALRYHRNNSYQHVLEKKNSIQFEKQELESIFHWSDLKKISNIINSSEFITKYGQVLLVKTNSIFIALGTSSGNIVIFNYKQEIDSILVIPEEEERIEVTCISFSSDCTFFIAGYKDGTIRLWDLKNGTVILPYDKLPYHTLYPSESESSTRESHAFNSEITYVKFLQSQTHQFISIDETSLILRHNGARKLMKTYFTSERLFGTNDISRDELQLKVLNCGLLPMGSSHQITDGMGVMALMTQDTLTIISTISLNDPTLTNVKPHFKVSKSKESGNKIETTAMSWFPCVNTLSGISCAKLAYSWNNVLGILELENNVLPSNLINIVNNAKDKDKAVPKLPFTKTCKLDAKLNIIDIKWVQSNILSIFVNEENESIKMMTFFYDNKSLIPIAEDTFTNEVKQINIAKHCFILLNENKILIGRQLSWADILLSNISNSNYLKALNIADEFYNTTSEGKLVAVGLPIDKNKRSALIRPYLIEIMKESINYSVDHLNLYLEIVSYTGYIDILENLMNYINNDQFFFQNLEPFILSQFIISLPPIVLKRLVEYYASNDMGDLLTELICTLDLTSLDIDVTIQLCKKYKLRECLIFIWNSLLNDYETPLLEFIKEFQNPEFLKNDEYLKAYDYISFILTGRQYPTEKYIVNGEFDAIKSVCDILFSSSSIIRDNQIIHALNDDTIFPYLYTFLKINSFKTLSALNEFFESSFLNDQIKYNRQFLIEALLDLFETNEHNFNEFDKCQLSIFIARNYPKYSQFIRLSDSILNSVVNKLSSNLNLKLFKDCELALQSLISKYLPDDEEFIDKLKIAGYYNVLVDYYNSEGKYSMALEMWLKKDENKGEEVKGEELAEEVEEEEEDYVKHLMILIDQSFAKNKNMNEKIKVIKVLKTKFKRLVKLDNETFFKLIDKYSPQLHIEILKIDDDLLKYDYLQRLFNGSKNSIELDEFLYEYLRLLIEYDRDQVFEFISNWKSQLSKIYADNDQVLQLLKEKQIIDGQACLFAFSKEYSKAIDTIIDYIIQISNEINESNKDSIINLINYATEIIESPQTYNIEKDNLTLNEQLWLKLINSLIKLANTSNSVEIHNFLNKLIHDCFKKISDYKLINNKGEQSFLKIFNLFLESSSIDDQGDLNHITKLSNIRNILQDLFISYNYENEILKIMLKIINNDFKKNMKLIQKDNLSGWILNNRKCNCCDKLILGMELNEEVVDQNISAWENKEYYKIQLKLGKESTDDYRTEFDKKFHYLELIFFECGHSYHSKCLENLHSPGICILCK
ncbi:VPS8 [Candida pseudojiufengensis]|uniref:VPS8 n=1 Tax=Candida pseudojiufengensis TaxID=497109 RepID=UPI002223F997|nr:VPS8 [Candida pseudojiufengensis]KAI5959064.1 VPS8 [Candida pseudojiufengensis]